MTASHLSLTDIRGGYKGTVSGLVTDLDLLLRRTRALATAYERRREALIQLADDVQQDPGDLTELRPDDATRLAGLLPWLSDDEANHRLLHLAVLVDERYTASQHADAVGGAEANDRLVQAEDAVREAAIAAVRADDQAANR